MSTISRTEVMKEFMDEHDPQFAEEIALEYKRLVEVEGFEQSDEVKRFAVRSAKEKREWTARPTKDFHKVNKKASVLARGAAREAAKEYEDELSVEGEDFISTVQEKLEEVKETAEDTEWKAVRYEIKNNLQTQLRNPAVEENLRRVIREHSKYDYNENEVHVFANEVIEFIVEDQAEAITNKIYREMTSTELSKEKNTAERAVHSMFNDGSFAKGVGKGIGSKVTEQISKKGVAKLAGIVGSAAVGIVGFV